MDKQNKSNYGLELKEIESKVEPVNGFNFTTFVDLQTAVNNKFQGDGYFIVYLDYKVIIGKFKNEKFITFGNEQFEPKFIQKLRVFNKEKELFIWRTEGKLKGRLRTDNDNGKGPGAVEVDQVLFGTKVEAEKSNENFTCITEDRGTEILLPFKLNHINDQKNRVKITTRNYLDYNELGQAGYVDCRFVEFTFGENNKPIGDI